MVLPSRRVVDEPGAPEHGQVLAHVRDLAPDLDRQLADGELAVGEGLEDAQPLGISEGPTDRREPLAVGVGGRHAFNHDSESLTDCANTQVPVADGRGRGRRDGRPRAGAVAEAMADPTAPPWPTRRPPDGVRPWPRRLPRRRPAPWPRRWPPKPGARSSARNDSRSDDARPGPELREPSLARIDSRPIGRASRGPRPLRAEIVPRRGMPAPAGRAARAPFAPRSCLAEECRRLPAGPRAPLAPRSCLAEECRRLPAGPRRPFAPRSCLAEECRDLAGACRRLPPARRPRSRLAAECRPPQRMSSVPTIPYCSWPGRWQMNCSWPRAGKVTTVSTVCNAAIETSVGRAPWCVSVPVRCS